MDAWVPKVEISLEIAIVRTHKRVRYRRRLFDSTRYDRRWYTVVPLVIERGLQRRVEAVTGSYP